MRRSPKILGALFLIALLAMAVEPARGEDSLGDKLNKIFTPTPTPTPRKHHKSATKKKDAAEKSASPQATATPAKSPTPLKKSKPSPSGSPTRKKKGSPSPSPRKKTSPTPTPTESPTPAPSPTTTPEDSAIPSATPAPSPSAKKKGAPASISGADIVGYESYPPNVRKITDTALELTARNLDYKYGSADPTNGGMDCSGFIFYLLTQNGVRDVPRDSSQQYNWVRKAGNFKAVNSRHDDTFELNELAPGDLLFWTGTYSIDRDPPITHAMIYLGREKATNQRIMVGASDGRTYKGESRYGVSVFDFKITPPAKTNEGRLTPIFIGYGHVPGL